jgi:hypothetical protein
MLNNVKNIVIHKMTGISREQVNTINKGISALDAIIDKFIVDNWEAIEESDDKANLDVWRCLIQNNIKDISTKYSDQIVRDDLISYSIERVIARRSDIPYYTADEQARKFIKDKRMLPEGRHWSEYRKSSNSKHSAEDFTYS